jgi:hypothetical protein
MTMNQCIAALVALIQSGHPDALNRMDIYVDAYLVGRGAAARDELALEFRERTSTLVTKVRDRMLDKLAHGRRAA